VSDIIERRSYKAGETVFREGEQGSSAFVVQSGEVVISKVVDGKDQELAVVGKGGIFGEMALIDEQPRMATAKVRDGATIMTISKLMYKDKLKQSDPFIRALLRILVETVRSSSK
jgi:CRP/FNR family cyclic AMP-dependent transcriptional regulator